MNLCIDIGNSQIYCGVFHGHNMILYFRCSSAAETSSDQFGVLLINLLHENAVSISDIKNIAISSVVPNLNYSINAACLKYLKINPVFLDVYKQNIVDVLYANPSQLGLDRLANAIGGVTLFPNKNLLIIDCGTATTICVINKEKQFLGGAIMPGIKTCAHVLNSSTAQLPIVDIVKPFLDAPISTHSNIQLGLYYSQLGGIKELLTVFQKTLLQGKESKIIATGGFSHLFKDENLYEELINELVLIGLNTFLNKREDV